MRLRTLILFSLLVSALAPATAQGRKPTLVNVWVLTTDGRTLEGAAIDQPVAVSTEGESRDIRLREILSYSSAAAASDSEFAKIRSGLKAITGSDRKAMEAAVVELTDIGLPVMSPLLAAYKDTDAHEPNPLYHLFERIIPGYADRLNRDLDLFRFTNGSMLRGRAHFPKLAIQVDRISFEAVEGSNIRRLAVRQPTIQRNFDVQALRHCTQIEFLDTGVRLSNASKVEVHAEGYTRLSFDIDGWSCDPDGIKVPGPNYKTTDVDGFAFGALVGRVGAAGPRWKAGRALTKTNLGTGRLEFAVNDNGHWQNNVGSYRVRLKVTDAYDLGDPQ